jgi:hypothetical protein
MREPEPGLRQRSRFTVLASAKLSPIIRYLYWTYINNRFSVELWGLKPDEEVIAIAIEQVESMVDRLTKDQTFRRKYCQDPDGTLAEYLTPAEIRAIKTGDDQQLGHLSRSPRWRELSAGLCGVDPGP